jgi:hypothetical protein
MAKSRPPMPINQHLATVHALGHPTSPPPQTRWAQPGRGRGGEPAVATAAAMPPPTGIVIPPPQSYIPNTPGPVSLTQGSGSDLNVVWPTPAIDSTHNAASAFALRSSPSGAATWTAVAGVTSPYDLSGLAAGAAIDVQIQSSNATGASAWSATSTLTTAAAAGPYAPNAPAIASVTPPPDGTNTKLTVSWTAPAADGTHGAATGFNLRSSPSGAGTWTTVSGVASPYTLTGLSGAAAIDVEVQATNAAASPGGWSAVMTGTTWGATVVPGNWVAATSQTHGATVAPTGGGADDGDSGADGGDRWGVRVVREQFGGSNERADLGRWRRANRGLGAVVQRPADGWDILSVDAGARGWRGHGGRADHTGDHGVVGTGSRGPRWSLPGKLAWSIYVEHKRERGMVRVTGEQLQKTSGFVRAEARRAPVEGTYHGRPELVVLSVEDYALPRQIGSLSLPAAIWRLPGSNGSPITGWTRSMEASMA